MKPVYPVQKSQLQLNKNFISQEVKQKPKQYVKYSTKDVLALPSNGDLNIQKDSDQAPTTQRMSLLSPFHGDS